MTLTELRTLLKRLKYKNKDLPVNYSHFNEGEVPALPYILFFANGREDFIADNSNFFKREIVEIELYTKSTEFELLNEMVELLNEEMIVPSIIPFQYLNSEKFYITRLSIKI